MSGQKKRGARDDVGSVDGGKRSSAAAAAKSAPEPESADNLEFEDQFGDEVDEYDAELEKVQQREEKKKGAAGAAAADGEEEDDEFLDEVVVESKNDDDAAMEEDEAGAADGAAAAARVRHVFRPGVDAMGADEELDYDSSAYAMLHRLKVEWPCLSFDVLADDLGAARTKFPHTAYMVTGTQAITHNKNKIMLCKMSELHKTKHDDKDGSSDDESGSDSDDDLDDDPILEQFNFPVEGSVNRIRVCPQHRHLVAAHIDASQPAVHVWEVKKFREALDSPPKSVLPTKVAPRYSFKGLTNEGYALAWSPLVPGRLASGDCSSGLQVWNASDSFCSSWKVSKYAPEKKGQKDTKGHTDSIEDIAWSPVEADVFASCSSDMSIRIWDCRDKILSSTCVAGAHAAHVNVIAWNTKSTHLLVSGGDDGSMKVWDLRNFKSSSPAASYQWHKKAITSLEWHPLEPSVLAASSEDDTISIWDFALEHDEMPGTGATVNGEVPDNLFFVHAGQKHIKEIHWHPNIPSALISTASDGFNIFIPANMV